MILHSILLFQSCAYTHAHFFVFRPEIPEDNMAMMWCLGVRECPNRIHGCEMEMWEWEMEDHMRYFIDLHVSFM